MRIALLGAESTGKTALAEALAAHFNESGRTAIAVPEVLREWCMQRGREPRPQEQLAIAREIVQAHGGTIGLESATQSGTRFIVHVPALETGASPSLLSSETARPAEVGAAR